MKNKGKYSGWGNLLKERRELRFRSARELCKQVSIGISYPQYSRYEAGEQLPHLEQALAMGALLGIPALEMILEWCLAQIPVQDAAARAEVSRLLVEGRGNGGKVASPPTASSDTSSEKAVPLDDVIVFNRSHLRVFGSDPAYRDIFTYINSFGPSWIAPDEIARALDLRGPRVEEMLGQLSDLGVVLLRDGRCRAAKRNFYFPDDEDFFELRNMNLRHNSERILSGLSHRQLADRQAYRGLITRELTETQVSTVLGGVERLLDQVIALPETSSPRTIYSLCVLFGERFSRVTPRDPDEVSG